jgi:hypothetical protein
MLPYWGEITVELEGAFISQIVGPTAPAALLVSIATSGATAFLIIMAKTFGLILPRMLFEHIMPSPAR